MNKLKRCIFVSSSFIIMVGMLPLWFSSMVFITMGAPTSTLKGTGTGATNAQRSSSDRGDRVPMVEEFSFLIKDFKINHQGETNNLNISIRYRYVAGILDAAYPDFRLIANDIEDFLKKYPNTKDYWEILNKKLTLIVINKYPELLSITSEIQVSPSTLEPYLRSSIVTRHQSKRNNSLREKSRRKK